jgi:phage shock protein A
MPRGKKRTAEEKLNDQLTLLDEQISAAEAKVKALKKERKNVEEQLSNLKFNETVELIVKSGKSIEEIKELLLK